MASVNWKYEDEDKGWVVEVEVTATVVPFRGATRDEPADGGYLEDETFKVVGFKLEVGNHIYDMGSSLTPALAEALEVEVRKGYESDPDMQGAVYRLFEDGRC